MTTKSLPLETVARVAALRAEQAELVRRHRDANRREQDLARQRGRGTSRERAHERVDELIGEAQALAAARSEQLFAQAAKPDDLRVPVGIADALWVVAQRKRWHTAVDAAAVGSGLPLVSETEAERLEADAAAQAEREAIFTENPTITGRLERIRGQLARYPDVGDDALSDPVRPDLAGYCKECGSRDGSGHFDDCPHENGGT